MTLLAWIISGIVLALVLTVLAIRGVYKATHYGWLLKGTNKETGEEVVIYESNVRDDVAMALAYGWRIRQYTDLYIERGRLTGQSHMGDLDI